MNQGGDTGVGEMERNFRAGKRKDERGERKKKKKKEKKKDVSSIEYLNQ